MICSSSVCIYICRDQSIVVETITTTSIQYIVNPRDRCKSVISAHNLNEQQVLVIITIVYHTQSVDRGVHPRVCARYVEMNANKNDRSTGRERTGCNNIKSDGWKTELVCCENRHNRRIRTVLPDFDIESCFMRFVLIYVYLLIQYLSLKTIN